jgi:methionyl-tRNA formyltransferase
MKIVFFGTPHFAAEVLRYLLKSQVIIKAVVTQPDRPKGRSGILSSSEVKQVALEAGLHVLQPEKASKEDFLRQLAECSADLYVVVAFGQILPQKLLDLPPFGCINVHASLLPHYRGAAPIQRCLMDGVEETGVCIQKMVRQLDAGDVIAAKSIPVSSDVTFGQLHDKLCDLSKPMLLDVIHSFKQGAPPAKAQDANQVTWAPKIEIEECQLDWNFPAEKIHNKVRALSPRPGAWCWLEGDSGKKRLKILRTKLSVKNGSPGQWSLFEKLVYCGEGAVELLEVQPEGKKNMPAAEWLRGLKNPPLFSV